MNNTFGTSVSLTLFGESHGSEIGAVIDGLAPGIAVDEERIKQALAKRRPSEASDTSRTEKDAFRIVSGVFNGYTTGTPLAILIPNEDIRSCDYTCGIARPSHADYSAYCKYHGYEDYRGGGHFSGRLTAPLTAAGAIFLSALEKLGISVNTVIESCDLSKAADGDSVGGTTKTVISGVPAGVGEPWFDSVEGLLSHAVFSIGGIKGIEFGAGFAGASMRGSEFNDAFRMKNGKVITVTNNNGGINGGITNGMEIVFRCAVKPTPSIGITQKTVDFIKGEDTEITVKGRHDGAIVRRIGVVIDSVSALVLCDMLARRYGTDVFTRGFEG
ncbi:MAG: chorismate synthase [Eubacteriales bacterium]|nr:chorismate synthase [Eubacteriales bacterium]